MKRDDRGLERRQVHLRENLLNWRNIEDAMTESTKRHARMPNVRLVREHDLQDGDVANNGSRDCCDQ